MSTEGLSRMVTGSILRHFSQLELSTADEKHYSLKNTPLTKLALILIGLPHLGFRLRARLILAEAEKLNKHAHLLDAGCGYGIYTMMLAERGFRVDATDLEEERVKAISRRLHEYPEIEKNITVTAGSLTSLPFPSESYDGIICSEVIEHITDHAKAVHELARVLTKGGTLILSVPHISEHNKKFFRMFGHERPGYTKESLDTLARNAGLSLTSVRYYERRLGTLLFRAHNALRSPALMALFFYPLYGFYLVDYLIGWGEPNQIVVTAIKN